jgi:hypothetical protein
MSSTKDEVRRLRTNLPYVYRLTDKVNGKIYIGCRIAKDCSPDDLGVRYFTSSKIVKPLFKADANRFEKQILVTGEAEYVVRVEKSLIEMYGAVRSDSFYNCSDGILFHREDCVKGGLTASRVTSARMKSNHPMRNPVNVNAQSKRMKDDNPSKRKEVRSALSKASRDKPKSASHRASIAASGCGQKGAALNFTTRWKCVDCEFQSVNGVVSQHVKRTGHSGKLKLEKT